jgi:hypothetical protein
MQILPKREEVFLLYLQDHFKSKSFILFLGEPRFP